MKRLFSVCMFFCISGVQVCLAQLVFESDTVEVPVGLLDEKVEGVFHFRNSGTKEVTIAKVVASCGCTAPSLNKKSFKPGEEGEIRAVFTFGSRIGEQNKRIVVYTNSRSQAQIPLTLKTRIPTWVEMDSRILKWRQGEPASPQNFTVKVANERKIRIIAEDNELPDFKYKIRNTRPGVYTFTVVPKSVEKRATAFLRFKAVVSEMGTSRERQFGVHCLIR